MKALVLLFLVLVVSYSYGQQHQSQTKFSDSDYGNTLKFHPTPLLWRTASVSYERHLWERMAVGATLNYRPQSKAPFQSLLKKFFENDEEDLYDERNLFDIKDLKYKTWAFAPEVKVYLGEQGSFKGFYIAAFAKWETVKINYDYPLDFVELQQLGLDRILPITGDIKAFSGGIYVGVQWALSERFYLDWQIIGGNFGRANLKIHAEQNLSADEQKQLTDFAKDLKESIDDIDYDIQSSGLKIWGKLPWAGLRSGISVGYRF
ncbi:DUF3575 domain-containing protein [Flavobacterium sp. JP2137]|uniref:DUF3575 domain-containing protein n=1 Tax=Flavobacterium sp. JP2137 TaxID=3414510 RepID=UPI003D3014D9